MDYKGYKIKLIKDLKGDFAFSASNKQLRIDEKLHQGSEEDNNLIKDEAILAREAYVNEVNRIKSEGGKVHPSSIKKFALETAQKALIERIGQEEYSRIHLQSIAKPSTGETKVILPGIDEMIEDFDNIDVEPTTKPTSPVDTTIDDIFGFDPMLDDDFIPATEETTDPFDSTDDVFGEFDSLDVFDVDLSDVDLDGGES